MRLTVAQLAERVEAELVGKGCGFISSVAAVEAAGQEAVTFVTDKKHVAGLEKSGAGAVIVEKRIEGLDKPQLVVGNVNAALIKTLNIFAPRLHPAVEGVDPSARVDDGARIAKGASIGPGVVIERGVRIGENSVIRAGCKIGENSTIGENSRLDFNVAIYHNCIIGNNVIIQANTTIGSTGFGYRFIDGSHKLIPHNGTVVIEDFVEIGANCCVDRAKFGETRIGAGTKIDNLVQIAHNVEIGKCCLIAGQAGMGGSCKFGDGVVLAGRVGVIDHIEIGSGTMVGAASVVFHSVAAGQQLFGIPASEKKESLRAISSTKRLPKLIEQVRQLSTRVERLEAAEDDKK